MASLRYPPELLLRAAIRSCSSSSSSIHLSPTAAAASADNTYLAAACKELGKPLELIKQERKPLLDDEVRLAVQYSALNFGEVLKTQGKYQEKITFPYIPGNESVGRVLEVGSKVRQLRPGDHVISLALKTGSFANEAIGFEQGCYKIEGRDRGRLKEAAALISSYSTAYVALVRRAAIKSSDTVLVTAAAGSLGLAIVDLAANIFGANVIGACGGPEKCELVKRYGAKATIDYTSENLQTRVKELTKGKGVNIIADMVGGKVLEDCLKNIAFEGRVLTLGFTSGNIPKLVFSYLLVKNFTVHGVFWGNYRNYDPPVFKESVREVIKLWEGGRIKPYVTNVFKLSQANEAFDCLMSRRSTGKVVVECNDNN